MIGAAETAIFISIILAFDFAPDLFNLFYTTKCHCIDMAGNDCSRVGTGRRLRIGDANIRRSFPLDAAVEPRDDLTLCG